MFFLTKRSSGKTPYWDVGYQPATRHEERDVSDSTWLQENLSKMGSWEPIDIYDGVKDYLLNSIKAAREAKNGRGVKSLSNSLSQWQGSHSQNIDKIRQGKMANKDMIAKIKEALLVHASNIALKSAGMPAEPHDPRHATPAGKDVLQLSKRY